MLTCLFQVSLILLVAGLVTRGLVLIIIGTGVAGSRLLGGKF